MERLGLEGRERVGGGSIGLELGSFGVGAFGLVDDLVWRGGLGRCTAPIAPAGGGPPIPLEVDIRDPPPVGLVKKSPSGRVDLSLSVLVLPLPVSSASSSPARNIGMSLSSPPFGRIIIIFVPASILPPEVCRCWFEICDLEAGTGGLEDFVNSLSASIERAFRDR